MQSIRHQVEIAWPLKALFHFMADPETHPQWRPHVQQAIWDQNNKNIVGSQLIDTHWVLGRVSAVVWKLTEINNYQKRVLLRELACSQTFYIIEYESRGEHTLLTVTIRVEANDRILASRLSRAIARKSMAVFQGLKEMLETDQ